MAAFVFAKRVPGDAYRMQIAVPDLRHEAVVGAEAVAEILVLEHPVVTGTGVAPVGVGAVPVERAAVPFLGEVRAVRRSREAQQQLAAEVLAFLGTPLKVGAEDAVEAAALDFAIGEEQAREARFKVSARPRHAGPGAEILIGEARFVGAGQDRAAAAAILREERGVAGLP